MNEELDYFLDRFELWLRREAGPDTRTIERIAQCLMKAKQDLRREMARKEEEDNTAGQEHMAEVHRYGSGD